MTRAKRNGEAPKRVCIYTRLSTLEQTNGTYDSCDAQEARCRDLARAQGAEVVEVYRDTGSGGSMDRPGLQAILDGAKAGGFDAVYTFKLDRVSRSVADFWQIEGTLREHGVGLVSLTESFDSGTPTGKLMMTIISGFAEYELDTIRFRTRAGMAGRAAAGFWPTRWEPFGFKKDRPDDGGSATLVPDPEAVPWARQVFQRYADGEGPGLIAEWLNDEHVPTHDGKPWTRRRVLDMLKHPVYAGMIRWAGEVYEGRHEAIIAPALWQRVQRQLESPRHGRIKRDNADARDLYHPALYGILRDPEGEPFGRYWCLNRHGQRFYYYTDPKTGKRFNAKALDEEIARVVRLWVTAPDVVAGTLDSARQRHARKVADLARRRERIEHEIAAVDRRKDRLVDAVAEGLPAGAATGKLAELERQRGGLVVGLAGCDDERTALDRQRQGLDTFAKLREFFERAEGGEQFIDTGKVLRGMVHEIELDVAAEEVALTFSHPRLAEFSNPGEAENGAFSASPDMKPAPQVQEYQGPGAGRVRNDRCGVGEGIRTPDLQSHSLSL